MEIKFENNINKILKMFEGNELAALHAMGQVAVEIATDYMEVKYYRPIYDTGTLIGDVNFEVNPVEKNVAVGNSKEYAKWVHNGTPKMAARPYLKDAIADNTQIYEEVAAEQLAKGF